MTSTPITHAVMAEAGSYTVRVDDVTGEKFWAGGSPGAKGESIMDANQPLQLSPRHFAIGTTITAFEPQCESCFNKGTDKTGSYCQCDEGQALKWRMETSHAWDD